MILSCEKYKDRRERQEVWIKKIMIPYYYIIGNPLLDTEYVVDQENKIIYIKCKDTYDALCIKMYLGSKVIYSLYPTLKYLFKTDDDTMCDLDKFYKLFESIQGYDYGGNVISCDSHYSTYHYPNVEDVYKYPILVEKSQFCAGFFYFLSRKAVEILLKEKDLMYSHFFEDYAVSKILNSYNIKPFNFDAKSILTPDNA